MIPKTNKFNKTTQQKKLNDINMLIDELRGQRKVYVDMVTVLNSFTAKLPETQQPGIIHSPSSQSIMDEAQKIKENFEAAASRIDESLGMQSESRFRQIQQLAVIPELVDKLNRLEQRIRDLESQ